MWLFWLVIIALTSQTSPGPAVSVSIIDNQIWVQTASDSRQLTYDYDGIPKRLPAISPSGDALVYVVDHPVPNDAPKEELVVLDLSGKVLRRITPEGYVPGPFDRLDWLDAGRIGAMTCGHANCMYWVLNPQSGKTIQVMSGGFEYTWSHNREFVATWGVAYDCDDPREREKGCPMHDSVGLDPGNATYPPEWAGNFDDSYRYSHSHDIGISTPVFVWSPDDKWVAFTDLIGPEDDWYVVILSPDGKMLRDTVPIDPDYNAMLEWLMTRT
ncbi:MAG: hypothetical protein ABSC64_09620 [Candidatus Korobacteraceae bacterium]|jgi:hypothetical protein